MERSNQDVENILACWLRENETTHWADGLRFVQWQKNNRHLRGIERSPYQAMFGEHRGATLPSDVWERIETEEELAEAINQPIPENYVEQEQDEYERGFLPAMTSDEVATKITIQNTCCICDRQYEGSTKCSRCQEYCHDSMPCSEGGIGAVICQLCGRKNDMENQRSGAHSEQAKQAEKMLCDISKRLQPLNVGANVAILVPEVDKGSYY